MVQGHFLNHDSAGINNIDWWKVTLPGQPDGTQVRYKVALFSGGSAGNGNSATIPDSESTGSKLYGLTQMAITNFNPTTAPVWLHNDLNTNNMVIGLQPGFHIVRARMFLPRTNQSSVYNTFLQTFYYDGALPTGVIAFPTADGANLTGTSYTVVVRVDSTVTGVDFNIQDGNSANDDTNTGSAFGNGNSNGVPVYVAANAVTPDANLSAQYPNYPQEYRFVYTNVPASGTATINVRLKEFATSVYPNRTTILTRTVNTLAPAQIVSFTTPPTNGMVLTYSTNLTYKLQACFSGTLTSLTNNFNILINGVLQPQASYVLQPYNGLTNYCPNMKAIQFTWNNPSLGTNLLMVIYTNASVPISDTRVITIAPPLRISALENNNQLLIWDSAPGINYQVLATTNLLSPFAPVSDVIPGSGSSTFFFDPNPADQKFYQIQMVQ